MLAQQGSSLLNRYGEPVVSNSHSGTLSDYQYSHKCGGAHSLTFTKLTPRSSAARYRTSGTDADNTCGQGFRSVSFHFQQINLPDTSVLIPETDSSWFAVKTRLGLNSSTDHFDSKSNPSPLREFPRFESVSSSPHSSRAAFEVHHHEARRLQPDGQVLAVPLELQLSPGAPHLASKPANEHSAPRPRLDDDLDRPPVHGSKGTERRDLAIYYFVFFQAPQKSFVDGDEGRRVGTVDDIPVQGKVTYLAVDYKITLRIPGFQKAPKTAHLPQERSTFVFVPTVRRYALVITLSPR